MPAAPLPLSGHQIELVAGTTRAVVVEVGGGLRTFSVDGHDVLDGYGEDERASSGRGQVLAPWPNRVKDGQWSWAGRDQQLPLTEPALHNASHGLVQWLSWHADRHSDSSATLSTVVAPQPGWPCRLLVAATYTVRPGALDVELSVVNAGAESAPVGLGMHPYFTVGTDVVDQADLTLAAGLQLTTDGQNIPDGEHPSQGWSGPIGDAVLDTTFGELVRDPDGLARITLTGPSRRVTVWMDEHWRWAQVFSGDTLPESSRRRGLAIEPLTCPPNALRTGRDLVVLAPGETLAARWGVVAS